MKRAGVLNTFYNKTAHGRMFPPKKRNYFYASECDSCPRLIYMARSGFQRDNQMSQDNFFVIRAGSDMHEVIQKDFRKALGQDFCMVEQRFPGNQVDIDGMILSFNCRIDGFYTPDNALVEIKTMDTLAFRDWCEGGVMGRSYFMKYLLQSNLGCIALKRKGITVDGIWIVAGCRGTGQVELDRSDYQLDETILEPVWRRWCKVEDALKVGVPPKRKKKKDRECFQFCPFGKQCWDGEE